MLEGYVSKLVYEDEIKRIERNAGRPRIESRSRLSLMLRNLVTLIAGF